LGVRWAKMSPRAVWQQARTFVRLMRRIMLEIVLVLLACVDFSCESVTMGSQRC